MSCSSFVDNALSEYLYVFVMQDPRSHRVGLLRFSLTATPSGPALSVTAGS